MGWKKARFQQKKFLHILSLGEKLNACMVDFLVAWAPTMTEENNVKD